MSEAFEGDGEGAKNAASIGISPHTLSDGATFTADALFKKNLHDIKGLMELTYTKRHLPLSGMK